jgi:hypothetical protein
MPSNAPSSGSTARRFVWLAVGIVLFGVFWTIGWHLIANRIESHLPASLQQLAGQQAQAKCSNAQVRGYPFRFGLFCDSVGYRNAQAGLSAESGALRSAAQFYRPNHIVSEVDGPVVFSGSAGEGRIDWQALQTSIYATPGGLDRGSLDGRNISVDIDSADLSGKLGLRAERLTAHARKNGLDFDVAAYAEQVQSDLLSQIRAEKLTLEATLPNQAGLLDAPFRAPQGTYQMQLHRMLIELEEGAALEIAGPAQIGEDGLISGDLNLTIRNQQRFAELAARIDPDSGNLIANVAPMLGAFDTVPGDDAITVPLTVRNGALSMAFIPLGRLPAM